MNTEQREEVKFRATQGALSFKKAFEAGDLPLARSIVEDSLLERRQKDMIIYHYSL